MVLDKNLNYTSSAKLVLQFKTMVPKLLNLSVPRNFQLEIFFYFGPGGESKTDPGTSMQISDFNGSGQNTVVVPVR
jgi:hypothetical protein